MKLNGILFKLKEFTEKQLVKIFKEMKKHKINNK